MAKVTGPLLSQSAHGKLAQELIYKRRSGSNLIRKYHYPRKDVSLKQWTQRHIMGLLTAQWQCFSDATKLTWNTNAKKLTPQITGFNFFLRKAQTDLKTYHGLCGYWSMNEKTGAQVTDYSGQGNHGTLKPTYPGNCPTRVASFRKEYGNALSFDGVDDYVNCGHKSSLIVLDVITISTWIKIDAVPLVSNSLFLGKSANWNDGYNLFISVGSSEVKCVIGDGINVVYAVVGDGGLGVWLHVAVIVKSNGYIKVYKDGDFIRETNMPFALPENPTADFKVGKVYGKSLSGAIASVSVYDRELSADEIKKHYELLRLDKKRQPLVIH